MKKFLLVLAILLIPTLARADEYADQPRLSITEAFNKLNAKEGFFYSIGQRRGANFLAVTVAQKWDFALNAGLIGTDGAGVAVDYNLGALASKVDMPALKFFEYFSVGFGVGYRTLTLSGDLTENPKADNRFIYGPNAFFKFKF